MTREKVIDKINKLLALAQSPEQEEAQQAMLKAQKMLAEYKIEQQELGIEEDKEVSIETDFTSKTIIDWKQRLAYLIANNFACESFMMGGYQTFWGREDDAKIALQIYKYSVDVIKSETKKIRKHYRKIGMPTEGVTGTYASGFIAGMKNKFNDQLSQMAAMVLVKPEEDINNKLVEMGADPENLGWSKVRKGNQSGDQNVWKQGYETGNKTHKGELLEEARI